MAKTTSPLVCANCGAPIAPTDADASTSTCMYCATANQLATTANGPAEAASSISRADQVDPDEKLATDIADVTKQMRLAISKYSEGRAALTKLRFKTWVGRQIKIFASSKTEFSQLYDVMRNLVFIDGDDDDPGPIAVNVWLHMAVAIRGGIAAYFRYNRITKGEDYAKHKVETAVLDFQQRMEAGQFATWQHTDINSLIMQLKRLMDEPIPHQYPHKG